MRYSIRPLHLSTFAHANGFEILEWDKERSSMDADKTTRAMTDTKAAFCVRALIALIGQSIMNDFELYRSLFGPARPSGPTEPAEAVTHRKDAHNFVHKESARGERGAADENAPPTWARNAPLAKTVTRQKKGMHALDERKERHVRMTVTAPACKNARRRAAGAETMHALNVMDVSVTHGDQMLADMDLPETALPGFRCSPAALALNAEDVWETRAHLVAESWESETHREVAAAAAVQPTGSALVTLNMDPHLFYEDLQLIGEGAFGEVYRAKSKGNSEHAVAIKRMAPHSDDERELLEREVHIMRSLPKHANLLTSHMVFEFESAYWHAVEYVSGGSLYDYIRECGRMDEADMVQLLAQLTRALAVLHAEMVMHRDIKSDNVLVCGDTGRVKLCDFGFATRLASDKDTRSAVLGTVHWMAPEVCRGDEYGLKIDIWSLGMLALECALGEPLFSNLDSDAVRRMIAESGVRFGNLSARLHPFSAEFKDFCRQCLEYEDRNRPTASELLRHPLIAREVALLEEEVDGES
ncbi:Serine/threonine-protein kinase PAK 3 [Porphyridium purpureum]|uniref:Serine/threonine-protein kinase PAK 3 n=1 Tax=Porphyridium purpureum TaxID=35688 RepID=A0A5J4YYH5_PORPP|nr:Serine/threonine-protein kinase PAK 3 [Porphyridium purpureum]|eukprot:POR3124..scf209_3